MSQFGITQPRNTVTLIRGESKTFQLEVKDPALVIVDLTNARVLMSVKKQITDKLSVIFKDSINGVSEVDIDEPKAGRAKIFVLPGDTRSMDVGEYVFDVWVVLPGGKQHPVVTRSTFEIVAGVTVIN